MAKGIIVKGDKAAIQAQIHEQNLPVEETKQKTIKGWEGKLKGLLQVLWEQGWIDVTKLCHYTMNWHGIKEVLLEDNHGQLP